MSVAPTRPSRCSTTRPATLTASSPITCASSPITTAKRSTTSNTSPGSSNKAARPTSCASFGNPNFGNARLPRSMNGTGRSKHSTIARAWWNFFNSISPQRTQSTSRKIAASILALCFPCSLWQIIFMATFFRDALLVQLDPVWVQAGNLRVADGRIVALGPDVVAAPGDEVVECNGAVLMPGLVNGHTHLYSALAAGMPAPPRQPTNFYEILQFLWWRLDRAHTLESVEVSGQIGALAALRCGTTTLVDHHASPSAIEGSLAALERGIAAVGCRGVLCYEVTDRNGSTEGREGLAENERYIKLCRERAGNQFAAMVGAHA